MEAKKSRTKYWALCFFWTALMAAMLIMPDFRQWFWLALPGATTYFALGMDIM
ncbi:MAG: hypothetical protein MUF12_02755 [Sediminibacterium sp.]|jgi:hypothetical protein|nr:hypothetical protein [Hydrotalea sp.]MCU0336756.1 hypothetical protein [Sediminibacterium sp.]